MGKAQHSLQGKVAVITGGGRGIGKALAQTLSREGMKVAVGDIDAELSAEVVVQLGAGAIGSALDVTDHRSFTSFLDTVERELGPIDGLINNAGIMGLGARDEESEEVAERQLAINLHAVIHGTKEAVRRMRKRNSGHIVNMSSVLGRAGFAGGGTYSASKFGVFGFSEVARRELKGSGVEVTVVIPGVVDTQLSSGVATARGVRSVTPQDVADAIVGALRSPRFEVYVPKALGPLLTFVNILPIRLREAFGRVLRADRTLLEADRSARQEYEANVGG